MARLVDDYALPVDADDIPRPIASNADVKTLWADGSASQWPVSIVFTPTQFGGKRPWYVCPRCKRRCRKLYPDVTLRALGCRVCLKLRYFSQRSLAYNVRLMARMERLIREMHGSSHIRG